MRGLLTATGGRDEPSATPKWRQRVPCQAAPPGGRPAPLPLSRRPGRAEAGKPQPGGPWVYARNGGLKVTPSAGANTGSLIEMFTVHTAGDVQTAALCGWGEADLAGRGRLCWCPSVIITGEKRSLKRSKMEITLEIIKTAHQNTVTVGS